MGEAKQRKLARAAKKSYCFLAQERIRRGLTARDPCNVKWPSNPRNWCMVCRKNRELGPPSKSSPSIVKWQGLGWLSPQGIILTAYSENPTYVLKKFEHVQDVRAREWHGQEESPRDGDSAAREHYRRQVMASAGLELGVLKEKTHG